MAILTTKAVIVLPGADCNVADGPDDKAGRAEECRGTAVSTRKLRYAHDNYIRNFLSLRKLISAQSC